MDRAPTPSTPASHANPTSYRRSDSPDSPTYAAMARRTATATRISTAGRKQQQRTGQEAEKKAYESVLEGKVTQVDMAKGENTGMGTPSVSTQLRATPMTTRSKANKIPPKTEARQSAGVKDKRAGSGVRRKGSEGGLRAKARATRSPVSRTLGSGEDGPMGPQDAPRPTASDGRTADGQTETSEKKRKRGPVSAADTSGATDDEPANKRREVEPEVTTGAQANGTMAEAIGGPRLLSPISLRLLSLREQGDPIVRTDHADEDPHTWRRTERNRSWEDTLVAEEDRALSWPLCLKSSPGEGDEADGDERMDVDQITNSPVGAYEPLKHARQDDRDAVTPERVRTSGPEDTDGDADEEDDAGRDGTRDGNKARSDRHDRKTGNVPTFGGEVITPSVLTGGVRAPPLPRLQPMTWTSGEMAAAGVGPTQHNSVKALTQHRLSFASPQPPPPPARPAFSFTPTPPGGFPEIHQPAPEGLIRDLDPSRVRAIWEQPEGTAILFQVANVGFPRPGQSRVLTEVLTDVLQHITGESNFIVVAPEPTWTPNPMERGSPTCWAALRLSKQAVSRITSQRVWSCREITIYAYERTLRIPRHLATIGGYAHNSDNDIESTIRETFAGDAIWPIIVQLVQANPRFAHTSAEEAADAIVESLDVRVTKLSNGNINAAVYCDSPTASAERWVQWRDYILTVPFRSLINSPGIARPVGTCGGCHSADHTTHTCPFPEIEGWNAPLPGTGRYGHPTGNNTTPGTAEATSSQWTNAGQWNENVSGAGAEPRQQLKHGDREDLEKPKYTGPGAGKPIQHNKREPI
ncbi:hypothetical protein C2E23DRAFT_890111 [Lenzites betulinus]|nr:hypothetical protein C2E23DRAFT_890111 [Lenzites betulinus]